MANDVELFKGGNLPSYLQGDEPSEATKALIGGGSSLRRISIRGSVFRMMLGGDELAVNEDRSLNLIVVAAAPAFARTYYEGEYVEGANESPDCWSDDGVTPSEHVDNPQCGLCAKCPQNIKGSGNENSRACRYSARVAVMLEGDDNYEVYGMSIPATSLFGEVERTGYDSLQKYAQKLASHKYDVNKVVTEFRFDTDSSTPKLMFRAVRPVSEEEWDAIKRLETDEETLRHTGPREFRDDDDDDGVEADDAPLFAEDEDAKPAAKRSKASKPAAKDKKAAAKPPVDEGDEEEEEEPVKRPSKKQKVEEVEDDDLDSLLNEWASDDDWDEESEED